MKVPFCFSERSSKDIHNSRDRKRNSVDPFRKSGPQSEYILYIIYIYIFFTFFLSHFFFSSFLFKYRSIGFFVRTLSLNFFLRFFGFSRFCLNKYIHEQGTARQAEVCAPATPSFFFCFLFFLRRCRMFG